MTFDEYRQLDGLAMAEAVANKEVTAQELLEVAIARAEAVNPLLNGLVTPLYDEARKTAQKALQGPLAGVPMLAKDYFQEMAGAVYFKGNEGLKRLSDTSHEY